MKDEKLKSIKIINIQNDEDCYSINDIERVADKVDIIIPERLVASIDGKIEGLLNIVFFEQVYTLDGVSHYSELCRVSGPSGNLRECRHTYFSNDGYIFYMDRSIMIAMVDYLTLYYDMD